MENSGTRLVVYVTLMTLGVVLMVLSIGWLMFLGLALITLAEFLVFQKTTRSLRAFLTCAVGAVVILILDSRDGDAFVQGSRPIWFYVLLVGVGIWGIISAFQKWRKRGVPNDA
jgi:hypothetical protein